MSMVSFNGCAGSRCRCAISASGQRPGHRPPSGGGNPSTDQMRRETVLVPLDLWRVYYYRSNAWSNPLSSDASSNSNQTNARSLPTVPDGIRIELTLPEGRAMNGVLTMDWVNPLRSNSRS